ncbi:hypothetical protein O6H91_01G040600 [Diphasiastrum complanatum]|uniref:Uncharacterized protein n=1 Tax=Diphasiastrum complanatum TaxID=34168 RepID=A0ACC2EQ53_DIPCM|nr:hypothetical protein O6H91_01G040600 [Diphasiastrum complanatum]
MQNDEGDNVDLYIPRKCSSTNRLITSKDHASVQLNVGHLDEHGVYTGQFTTFAFCGFVRAQGDVDSALDRLWQKKKAELDKAKFDHRFVHEQRMEGPLDQPNRYGFGHMGYMIDHLCIANSLQHRPEMKFETRNTFLL